MGFRQRGERDPQLTADIAAKFGESPDHQLHGIFHSIFTHRPLAIKFTRGQRRPSTNQGEFCRAMPRMAPLFALITLLTFPAYGGDFTAKKDVGGLAVELGVRPVIMGAPLQEDAAVMVTLRIGDNRG